MLSNKNSKNLSFNINWGVGSGVGGLGIGDWSQSPIPNPQSPIPNPHEKIFEFVLIKHINY